MNPCIPMAVKSSELAPGHVSPPKHARQSEGLAGTVGDFPATIQGGKVYSSSGPAAARSACRSPLRPSSSSISSPSAEANSAAYIDLAIRRLHLRMPRAVLRVWYQGTHSSARLRPWLHAPAPRRPNPFFFPTARSMASIAQTETVSTAGRPRITAENVYTLFPDVTPHLVLRHNDSSTDRSDLEGYDEEQVRLMEEVCIVLDSDDKPIGSGSKKTCHLMENINKGLLHRAFSVFLFNSKNELLLQQRATEKITFPDMWTNTCCSHPLGVPGETGSELEEAVLGAKRAAQRKLNHELGIQASQVPIEKFKFLTRIHYLAPSDGKWGEHEIDYILFIKADVDVSPSPNEVRDVAYVTPEKLKAMFEDPSLKFTPWFKLICTSMLFDWWQHLDSGLDKYLNEKEIRRM